MRRARGIRPSSLFEVLCHNAQAAPVTVHSLQSKGKTLLESFMPLVKETFVRSAAEVVQQKDYKVCGEGVESNAERTKREVQTTR